MSINSELIYALEDRPPPLKSLFAGVQHLLASFVGIVTPALIIGGVLDLGAEISYLISMSLIASGIGTLIQATQPFGVGAKMLCLQGTSFTFVGVIITIGLYVRESGGTSTDLLSLIFGLCIAGSVLQIALSPFIPKLKKFITPLVTGIVVTSIGVSLIKVAMTDLAGGLAAESFGSPANLFLGLAVIVTVIVLNCSNNDWVRLSSILAGLIVGLIFALLMGELSPSEFHVSTNVSVPTPFLYGLDFDALAFIPIAVIFLISSVETAGDITANCSICNQPVHGGAYVDRVRRGVLADGVNSLISATLNSFPNTTFSQNNGVIQLTGIASRHVGIYVACMLMILGLVQGLGDILQLIPKPVIGGATMLMFGSVAATGLAILGSLELNRRQLMIIGISLGLGLGPSLVPGAVDGLPTLLKTVLGSAAASAGLTAILLHALLPDRLTVKARSK
jgi:xanthine permease XanP